MARMVVTLVLGVLLLQGCATTSSSGTMALENRVQALENRLAVVEADMNVSGTPARAPSLDALPRETGPTATVASASEMSETDIQRALKNAGYYAGVLDGKIGSMTKAAIREFQDDMGLKVDGIAGRNTKEKLFKYL